MNTPKKRQTTPTANPPLEKFVQQQITALFRACGGTVRTTSQTRASQVSPGIPDLLVHFPGVFVWFECKTYRRPWKPMARETWRPNPLAPEQDLFRRDCITSNVAHWWGGLPEAEALVIELGLATRRPDGQIVVSRKESR
jgi:hypothetical protein